MFYRSNKSVKSLWANMYSFACSLSRPSAAAVAAQVAEAEAVVVRPFPSYPPCAAAGVGWRAAAAEVVAEAEQAASCSGAC